MPCIYHGSAGTNLHGLGVTFEIRILFRYCPPAPNTCKPAVIHLQALTKVDRGVEQRPAHLDQSFYIPPPLPHLCLTHFLPLG
ncbi:hypothetical protein J6590_008726 [Homalodisca vitripennis]|nr:hypothetical protein J6590_008726 [Homalodisca vitripennis]